MRVVNILRLQQYSIYQQLLLEEALLRTETSNWCIVNDGARVPAIVMGISGKLHELVNVEDAKSCSIPVIKRFTGGGTVVVDGDTLFSTLIIKADDIPEVQCFPQPIMKYTEQIYSHVFGDGFSLRQNDYTFDSRKFGGNAQAITRGRWLHHTSFLWDYQPHRMALLKQPSKAPEYRQGRAHEEFVVRLKEFMPSRAAFPDLVMESLERHGFTVQERSVEEAEEALQRKYLCGTKLVELSG